MLNMVAVCNIEEVNMSRTYTDTPEPRYVERAKEIGDDASSPSVLKVNSSGFEYNPFISLPAYKNIEINPKNLDLKNIIFGGANKFTSTDVAGDAATNGNFVVGYFNDLGKICEYNIVLGLYNKLSHERYGIVIGTFNSILNTSGKYFGTIIGSYNSVQPDKFEPVLIGNELTGNRDYQTVIGYANDPTRTARFVVGDGYPQGREVVRHNALEIDKDAETGEYSMKLGDTTVKESELGGGGGGTKIKGVYNESTDKTLLTSAQVSGLNQLYVEIELENGAKSVLPILFGTASTVFKNTSYATLLDTLLGYVPNDIYYYDDDGTSQSLQSTDVTDFTFFQGCCVIAGGAISPLITGGIEARDPIVVDSNNHVVYWTGTS